VPQFDYVLCRTGRVILQIRLIAAAWSDLNISKKDPSYKIAAARHPSIITISARISKGFIVLANAARAMLFCKHGLRPALQVR
jgi:hypothetical protein